MYEGKSSGPAAANFQTQSEEANPKREKSLALLDEQADEYWQIYRGLQNRSPNNVDGPYLHLGIDLSDQRPSMVSTNEISKASMGLLKQFHPDKWVAFGINNPGNEQRLRNLNILVKNINNARDILLNDTSRQEYDQSLVDARTSQTPPQGSPPPRQAETPQNRSQTWSRPDTSNRAAQERKNDLRRELSYIKMLVLNMVFGAVEKNPTPNMLSFKSDIYTLFRTLELKIMEDAYYTETIKVPLAELRSRMEAAFNNQLPNNVSAKSDGEDLVITLTPMP